MQPICQKESIYTAQHSEKVTKGNIKQTFKRSINAVAEASVHTGC